ncbi:DNA-binding transcriptional MocR family regulator [Sphingomonas naasensis]|uniref:MarR family transcriptional regulator n=1 Tax=Sphingomonas naasensis TaxID=1344951 RepID=A0A4S1WT95_9SPHN|nr:hypothetical protein [Sphingomonas naasensis]NIJ19120.1 DNA-binding transcriptional MocR family regulator [Sphingomonas naasensis]TGX46313.1 hypothetical protein E5A74_03935 [Sphingomonas naasensis]
MPARQELSSFIRSTFRSVWALELLCFLRKHRDRAWPQRDLVAALRGSDLVVSQSIESLLAAGLVVIEPGQLVRYQPTSEAVDDLADAAQTLYASRPDAVRRMIVAPTPSGLTSFADAFKLWRD